QYAEGSNVQLTANPGPSYVFTGWSGDASGNTNPLTVTMDSDKNITATFTLVTYTLTLSTTGSGSVNAVPPGPVYNSGTMVTITATPAAGNHLDSWSGDASGHANPLVITMDADKSITGNFLADDYTWSGGPSGSWTTATNWTPQRHTPHTDDILRFSS